MHSKEEPNCLFGGMAVPEWQSNNKCDYDDPAD